MDSRGNDQGWANRPLPVLLLGNTGYIAETDRLTMFDTGTGKVRRTVKPQRPPLSPTLRKTLASDIPAPLAAEVDGEQYVFAAFPVRSSRPYALGNDVELVGVHADTGKKAWSMLLYQKKTSSAGSIVPTVVGVHGHALVLRASSSRLHPSGSYTMAIDTRSRRLMWGKHVDGEILAGDVVVGRDRSTGVAAWSVKSGKRVWVTREDVPGDLLVVAPGGTESVVVVDGNDDSLFVLGAADGRERFRLDGRANYVTLRCEDGERSVVVCSADMLGGAGGWVGAFDRDTSELLWQVRSASDDVTSFPEVTTVWHGVVYATVEGEPVTIDARTGKAFGLAPAVAPYLVNTDVGVAVTDDGGLSAYPVAR